jgi:hypothetical protein
VVTFPSNPSPLIAITVNTEQAQANVVVGRKHAHEVHKGSESVSLMDPFRQESLRQVTPLGTACTRNPLALSGSGLMRAHTFRKYVSIQRGVLL